MTACELLLACASVLIFCYPCSRWNEDPYQICWECEHELGYEMFALGAYMLETGENPFI